MAEKKWKLGDLEFDSELPDYFKEILRKVR